MMWAALLAGSPAPLGAQAPAAAGLWQVATSALAAPPALEGGPTGAFWNAAADPHGRFTAGTQVVQTSDILGLAGFLAGVTYRMWSGGHLGLLVARMEMRDLVRTTTSPNSQPGTIPVYAQMAGLVARFGDGPLSAGGSLRVHDARFDALAERGVTVDAGVRARLHERLSLAAATYLLPVDLTDEPTTAYYAGAELVLARETRLGGLPPSRVLARYGATLHTAGGVDHAVGAGVVVDGGFRVDLALTGEEAYGRRSWRPGLGLSLRVGRYTVGVARSEGFNDVGATYRVLLDVEVER